MQRGRLWWHRRKRVERYDTTVCLPCLPILHRRGLGWTGLGWAGLGWSAVDITSPWYLLID